jgi:hypothetical protein
MKRLLSIALFPLLLSACQSDGQIPTYGNVSDITNLYGVEVDRARAALGDRGYQRIINRFPTSIWWNARTTTCATITISGGKVSYVDLVPASTCSR